MGNCICRSRSVEYPVHSKERPRTASLSTSGRRRPSSLERFEATGFQASYILNRPLPPPNGVKGTLTSPFVSQGRAKCGVNEGKTYRVKCFRKSGLSARDEQRLQEEAYLLRFLRHPNILKIHQVFRYEADFYYMVMEPANGGEVFDHLVRKDTYNELDARQVVSTMLEAIAYCHKKSVAHRDLRPEHLVRDSPREDAVIKLTGFGSARDVPNRGLLDQSGTPGYVAPEILGNVPHGTAVDMWAVGVLTFILLSGMSPFSGAVDQRTLYRAIKAGQWSFRDRSWASVSVSAKHLVIQMLTTHPWDRISAEEALQHPWMHEDEAELAAHDLELALVELRNFNIRRKLRSSVSQKAAAARGGLRGTDAWPTWVSLGRVTSAPTAPSVSIKPTVGIRGQRCGDGTVCAMHVAA